MALVSEGGMVHYGCADCEAGEYLPYTEAAGYECWLCGRPLEVLTLPDMLGRPPRRRYR